MNSTSRKFLVGEQVRGAPHLHNYAVEALPTGYVVCAPGGKVGEVGQAELIQEDDVELVNAYARCGQMFGFKLLYLEAGSGAKSQVSPALIACTSSPSPGAETTSVECEAFAISTSSWPTPTVSMITTSKPAASNMSTAVKAERARPPVDPLVAMLRMNTPSSITRLVILILSPRIAPPENGLEGSIAMMPTLRPSFRMVSTNLLTSVDFPLPGTPVSPTMCARPAAL